VERVDGYASPDGKQKLEFYLRPDGFYAFEESVVELEIEPDPDFEPEGAIFWETAEVSGLFASLEAAVAEAKSTRPHLNTWVRLR